MKKLNMDIKKPDFSTYKRKLNIITRKAGRSISLFGKRLKRAFSGSSRTPAASARRRSSAVSARTAASASAHVRSGAAHTRTAPTVPARRRRVSLWQNKRFMACCGGAVAFAAALVIVLVTVASPASGNNVAEELIAKNGTAVVQIDPATGEPVNDTQNTVQPTSETGTVSPDVTAASAQQPADTAAPSVDATVSGDTGTASADPTGITAGSVAAAPSAEPTTESVLNLKSGVEDAKVADLQQKLMDLDYMDSDETTNYYGPATLAAVTRFQEKNGLTADGAVGEETWNLLFSGNAKKYSATEGMSGDDIESIQNRLSELGYLESSVTGYFGSDTTAAVKLFQERNGLSADGTVGAATNEQLYAENVKANYIDVGTESETVKKLQKKLISLGYLIGTADGKYGDQTVAAVKSFQSKNDLVVDGYLGNDTKNLLLSGDAEANAFTIGSKGDDVEKLQNRLVKLGYMGSSTGYYGSGTENAVRKFQSRNSLTSDGKAGAQTLSALYSSDAKKAATSSSNDKKTDNTNKNNNNKTDNNKNNNKNDDKVSDPDASSVEKLISVASSKLGCKYVTAGKGSNTFDCSGFVYWCLKQIGVKQSYVTSTTWRTVGNYDTIKNINNVKAGDIICFGPHHVGIAISSSTMIDASSGSGKVVKRSFKTSYWKKNFVCARRVL